MRTIPHRQPNLLAGLFSASALLALASGCLNVSDSSFGSLSAVTNATQTGVIAADLKSVEVDNRFGAVRVVAVESGPVDWSWDLTVRAKDDALARQAADAAKCSVQRDGDRLRFVVSLPNTDGRQSFQSDFQIRVPKSLAVQTHNRFGPTTISGVAGGVEAIGEHGEVELRTVRGELRAQTSFALLKVNDSGPARLKNAHGGIEASGIHGALEAETSFASLVARDVEGPVNARNAHGRIEVGRAKGNADIKTSFAELSVETVEGDAVLANEHGSVHARVITGSVKATTSFGSLDVERVGPNVVCRNQHGSIRVQATSSELMTVEAETSFGSLDVRLPGSLKPAIQARTSFANVESDFPVLMKPPDQDPFADVAPGTPRVRLRNEHGSIRVVRE